MRVAEVGNRRSRAMAAGGGRVRQQAVVRGRSGTVGLLHVGHGFELTIIDRVREKVG